MKIMQTVHDMYDLTTSSEADDDLESIFPIVWFCFSYTSLMQSGIKSHPTLVIKLRATFLKVKHASSFTVPIT